MGVRWKVKALMQERDMSVDDLSKAAKITPNTARALYRGVNERIDFPTLFKVARALGVHWSNLLEEVEDTESGNSAPEYRKAA
jgi:DNA-binding Xre family transcriptional regulator